MNKQKVFSYQIKIKTVGKVSENTFGFFSLLRSEMYRPNPQLPQHIFPTILPPHIPPRDSDK